jgi:hypothetical protein
MTRILKVLVLGLVAALPLTAVAASSASAFTKFKADTGTTAVKGPQKGTAKFVFNPGTIECASGTFRGMVTSGAVSATIETGDSTAAAGEAEAGKKGIEWSNCTFLGIIGRSWSNNTCQLRFHAETGKVDIVPNSGTCASTGITFETIGCKIHLFPIPANQGLSGFTFTNSGTGTGKSVTVAPNASTGVVGITYTAEGCPFGNGIEIPNGEYSDSSVAGSSSVLIGGTTNTTNTMTASGISIS